ncbi:hypothetical protein TNCV_4527591 [Trichonephila clavipes]|nr:hypothetical protein TNCV_4527591 [Trichonephila clavipes]
MLDLSDFQRGQIVVARLARASVTRTSPPLGVSRGTASHKIMTSSTKQNNGPEEKLGERNQLVLKWIFIPKKRITAAKVTAELNQKLDSAVSMSTVRRHLH